MLFQSFESKYIGKLKNRVVMSAMTRNFADNNHCATNAMKDYYVRRAKDGVALLLTEGLVIHPSADGYKNVPHLSNIEQSVSWKKVTEAIHNTDSKIFAQLWHCGRISHEDFTGGLRPVSASSVRAEGINRQNNKLYAVPRALETSEINEIYKYYLNSAHLAFAAGFDGVQLHLGHGYLADSFFDSQINLREDQYGGNIPNRCRFAVELVEKFISIFGEKKVIVRISPSREVNGIIFSWPNLDQMISHLISEFDRIGLRMIDVSSARANYYETSGLIIKKIRPIWPHFIIGGSSLSENQAINELAEGYVDMVTWGRAILANPDFITRLKKKQDLLPMHPDMLNNLL
jgi:N-ethylmaleimide reductase